MRKDWTRRAPPIDLAPDAAATLLRSAMPDAVLVRCAAAHGGLSNTNIAVTLAAPPHRLVLRLYQGDVAQARKEAALARLLAGRVPVARFLHFAETNAITGHPFAVLEWIAGERLDDIAPALDDATLAALGQSVGDTLARIHAMRFDRRGFFADDLGVPEAIDLGPGGLRSYLRQQLIDGPGGERLGPALARNVLALAERDGHLLDTWRADPCLVHGDFNGSNILVRRQDDVFEVAAVLDWEFALSGIPGMDFGNLMRPPLGAHETFARGLARGYRDAGGTLPADWLRIARIADLFAWADILGRQEIASAVLADARIAMAAALDRKQTG